MRISDWSSDVCSSDLQPPGVLAQPGGERAHLGAVVQCPARQLGQGEVVLELRVREDHPVSPGNVVAVAPAAVAGDVAADRIRSEEHTSELQSLMRISYAVFCLKQKKNRIHNTIEQIKY